MRSFAVECCKKYLRMREEGWMRLAINQALPCWTKTWCVLAQLSFMLMEERYMRG